MPNNSPPDIFLSYAWANIGVADEIDQDFKSIGITFRRDVRDAPYRTSIKEFMHQIGKTDFVLMLISDEYLRSENCMYEVTELLGTHEFEKRILPIVLDNARHIFKAEKRAPYYDFWKEKCKEAERLKRKHPNQDFVEHAKKYTNIVNHLDIFFQKIVAMNVSALAALKNENYGPMLKLIGFKEESLLEEAIAINKIEDMEEKELALEAFLKKHPDNKYGLFIKAYMADEGKQYKKARNYYTALLERYPDYVSAYNNLALLLTDHFSDHASAKQHYEEALRLDSKYVHAHNNLAILLKKHYSDYAVAKQHYEEALRLNPQYANAHNNLANLLTDHFSDHAGAKQHYEEVIRLDPQHASAHNNLGNLLKNHYSDHIDAKKHYEEALRLKPQYAEAHNNLAILLKNNYSDYTGAKKHYEEAIRLDLQNPAFHNNLAVLLMNHFSDHTRAKNHYEEALRLHPKYAKAHYNLAILLKKQFSDAENAKNHYLKARYLDPTLMTEKNDNFFGVKR